MISGAPLKGLRSWLVGTALVLPACILAISGLIHFRNGHALDAAFPIPIALSVNNAMPERAYQNAAESLRSANPQDGDSQIWSAEARFAAGEKPQNLLGQVEIGLLHAPASAEGWAFLSEILAQSDPNKAALALEHAFTLAPYDFFWAGTRAQLSAQLWRYLDNEGKIDALREVRILWDEPQLRVQMLQLSAAPGGSTLMTRAYASEPDTIRTINRFLSARR
jgi:hypothetical protein